MKHNQFYVLAFKFFFAFLGLSSIVLEIVVLNQRGVFDAANFFSYFTVLSNVFAALMLLVGAWAMYGKVKSTKVTYLRGAATTFIIITGVVFSVLLSNYDPSLLTAVPWDNYVLHYIMPIVLVIDWLIDPPRTHLEIRSALTYITFPFVYLVYSLIRGSITGWYPYPFLNPDTGGYGALVISCVAVTCFVLIATFVTVRIQRVAKR